MRVIITIEDNKQQTRLLATLESRSAIKEVKSCIAQRRLEKAMITVLTKAKSVRAISSEENGSVAAQLILTPKSAYWDLT